MRGTEGSRVTDHKCIFESKVLPPHFGRITRHESCKINSTYDRDGSLSSLIEDMTLKRWSQH
jgi:hypothetical protein